MKHPSENKSGVVRAFRAGAAAVLAALPLVGCSDAVTGPSDVVGGAWKLESMHVSGASTFVPSDPSRFTVDFKDNGTIGVRADCNVCGGTYTMNEDRLTVPALTCTLALCATPRGEEFAGLVEGTSTLGKDGDDTLTFSSPDGTMTLTR